jgi:hypothetical protein
MAVEQGNSQFHLNIDNRIPPGVANALNEAVSELDQVKAGTKKELSTAAYRNLRDHRNDNPFIASIWAGYTEWKSNKSQSSSADTKIAATTPTKEREHLPTIELRVKSKAESHISDPGQRPTSRYIVSIGGSDISLSGTEMKIMNTVAKDPGIDSPTLWKHVLGDDQSVSAEWKRVLRKRVIEKTSVDGVPLIEYKKGNSPKRPSRWEVPNFNITIIDDTVKDQQPTPANPTFTERARHKVTTIFRHPTHRKTG